MARSRRMQRRGVGRRRPIDWVTTGQTYDSGSSRYTVTTTPERINWSLTTHLDFAEDGGISPLFSARSAPQLEQTVVRVKGQIHLTLESDPSWWENANGFLVVTHRIRVADQIPGTIDISEPDFSNLTPANMGNATFAQENFLWENREVWYVRSTWGETLIEGTHTPRKIDVDVRTQRRLEVGQSLSIMTEVVLIPDGQNPPGTWPDLFEMLNLRTLMRTIT